jgi:head-tail adaptor
MCKITQKVGSQKHKEQTEMWTQYKPWWAEIED